MDRWEYKKVLMGDNLDISLLDREGDDGWELVQIDGWVESTDRGKVSRTYAIFKRASQMQPSRQSQRLKLAAKAELEIRRRRAERCRPFSINTIDIGEGLHAG